MPAWARWLIAISLYSFLAFVGWALLKGAPMDPNDPGTKDDEK